MEGDEVVTVAGKCDYPLVPGADCLAAACQRKACEQRFGGEAYNQEAQRVRNAWAACVGKDNAPTAISPDETALEEAYDSIRKALAVPSLGDLELP